MGQLICLISVSVLIANISGEILTITGSNTWSCNPSSTECSMIIESDCDGGCTGNTYHCPTDPNSCELCELICNSGTNACKDTTFYSYSCEQVNIITNTSSTVDTILEGIEHYLLNICGLFGFSFLFLNLCFH